MKDLQVDATALPGKAFDLSEMPEPEVGIMTFNRCVAVDQWESMGRPDILEKNCHSTCPKSMIETTRMYHPNMKVDILTIPPGSTPVTSSASGASASDEDDPEYVPVEPHPEAPRQTSRRLIVPIGPIIEPSGFRSTRRKRSLRSVPRLRSEGDPARAHSAWEGARCPTDLLRDGHAWASSGR